MRRRCPHCGGGPIFTRWSRLLPVCPVCGLGLERGERGYWRGALLFNLLHSGWVGACFFNLMATEAVFSLWVVGFLLGTWPNPPWGLFQVTTIMLMVIFPCVFFPFSKTLFLPFDLLVRPPEPHEFDAPHEPSRHQRRDVPRDSP